MKRRRLITLTFLPLLTLPAAATPPAVNLVVELRWVDSHLPGAAQAGVRDGAVVVGTAGAVSPRGPAVVTSTARAAQLPGQRLLVQNGQRARIQLTTQEPLQWDAVVDVAPAGAVRGVYVNPQPRERRITRGFAVTPTWPGGRAPVQVGFSVDEEGSELRSTLALPLERWRTVARSAGGAGAPAPRGTVSSRDAAGEPERELQLRVSVQP